MSKQNMSKKLNRCQDKTKYRCENKTDVIVKLTEYMSKQKIDNNKQNRSQNKRKSKQMSRQNKR